MVLSCPKGGRLSCGPWRLKKSEDLEHEGSRPGAGEVVPIPVDRAVIFKQYPVKFLVCGDPLGFAWNRMQGEQRGGLKNRILCFPKLPLNTSRLPFIYLYIKVLHTISFKNGSTT